MKLIDWLKQWKLDSLKFNPGFLELEFSINEADKDAAWELYVELLTRVTTQALDPNDGDDKTALTSVHSLFPTTREILKKYGASCQQFHRLAIVILNQKIRPFTAKWHKISVDGKLPEQREDFRKELEALQVVLKAYARGLSNMAGVEDLTNLEDED